MPGHNFPAWLTLALSLTGSACRPSAAGSGSSTAPTAKQNLPQQQPSHAPDRGSSTATAAAQSDLRGSEWTAGLVDSKGEPRASGLLTDVRTARHEGFDRMVFEFAGNLPRYRLEYIDRPVRNCGAGDVVALAGDAWLSISFEPADAHTPSGAPTLKSREHNLALPVLLELELTCDFEAHVTWVAGVARPNRYRVLALREPTRLVVDVRHF